MEKSKKIIIALSVALILALIVIICFVISYFNDDVVYKNSLVCTTEKNIETCTDHKLKPFSGYAIEYSQMLEQRFRTVEHYKNGKLDGDSKTYDADNGVLQFIMSYKNGILERDSLYDKDGYVYNETKYKNGKLDKNIKRAFHYNGIMAYESIIKDNKETSYWYYENGKLNSKEVKIDGKKVSEICYDRRGKEEDCNKVNDEDVS